MIKNEIHVNKLTKNKNESIILKSIGNLEKDHFHQQTQKKFLI